MTQRTPYTSRWSFHLGETHKLSGDSTSLRPVYAKLAIITIQLLL